MKKTSNPVGQIREAVQHLNPAEVRELAAREARLRIVGATPEASRQIAIFLCPAVMSPARRRASAQRIELGKAEPGAPPAIEIWDAQLIQPAGAFTWNPADPRTTLRAILDAHADLAIALARLFPPFREMVVQDTIHAVSKENALFSLATALPDIMPSVLSLPWAVGQFASDTAFLTVNQTRMAFLIAAASDCPVGYREQRNEIGAVVAGAFGWRALARQLVGKIPMGGGLIPKAAVAYAGTFVAGQYLDKLYGAGYRLSRGERRNVYEEAFLKGKEVAAALLAQFRKPKSA